MSMARGKKLSLTQRVPVQRVAAALRDQQELFIRRQAQAGDLRARDGHDGAHLMYAV